MALDISSAHSFCVHGQNLFFDILTDTGLVFLQQLGLKFSFTVPGYGDFYVSEAGTQRLAAVTVSAIVRVLVLVVVLAVP